MNCIISTLNDMNILHITLSTITETQDVTGRQSIKSLDIY